MSFLVDANVLIYSAVDSEYRDPCLEILEAIATGSVDGRTSTAVLEEVWHIELSGRVGRLDGLARHTYTIFTPLLAVTDEAVGRALALKAPGLGANDRLHAATAAVHGLDVIVTADRAFDAVRGIRRIDPLDDRERRRLLADAQP